MSETWRGVSEEEAVRKLLQDAGPRPALPEEDLGAIREAARAEWRARYGERAATGRKSRAWWLAAAAAVLVGIGLIWWTRARTPVIAPVIASIERVSGNARWEIGSPLAAGSELATGGMRPARLTLRMRGGASVRLDAATQVRLASATMVELQQGAVYVDTGAAPDRGEEISVRAPVGLFRPAGTQFEVRLEGGATKLRVREGSVRLDRGWESVRAASGEELIVRGGGAVVRQPIAVSGRDWDWVGEAGPMLDIEGVSAREFLDWFGRETGRRIELADEETVSVAGSCVLHGSIAHLTLSDAPRVVLSSCGLGHRVSNGALLVFIAEKRGS
jgi:ferric-dicitrate binding protein FerR (iron transport regulator)